MPRIAVANNDAISITMPYRYVVEILSVEVLADEEVDIDAMETPMETKNTANWWVRGSEF